MCNPRGPLSHLAKLPSDSFGRIQAWRGKPGEADALSAEPGASSGAVFVRINCELASLTCAQCCHEQPEWNPISRCLLACRELREGKHHQHQNVCNTKKILRGINFAKITKIFSSVDPESGHSCLVFVQYPRDSPRSAWELQQKNRYRNEFP